MPEAMTTGLEGSAEPGAQPNLQGTVGFADALSLVFLDGETWGEKDEEIREVAEALQRKARQANLVLRQPLVELMEGIADQFEQIEVAQAEVQVAQAEAEATPRADLDAARAEAEATRADLDAARAEAEATRADLDAARAEAEATRADLDAAKAEAEATRAATQAEIKTKLVEQNSRHEAAMAATEQAAEQKLADQAAQSKTALIKAVEAAAQTVAQELEAQFSDTLTKREAYEHEQRVLLLREARPKLLKKAAESNFRAAEAEKLVSALQKKVDLKELEVDALTNRIADLETDNGRKLEKLAREIADYKEKVERFVEDIKASHEQALLEQAKQAAEQRAASEAAMQQDHNQKIETLKHQAQAREAELIQAIQGLALRNAEVAAQQPPHYEDATRIDGYTDTAPTHNVDNKPSTEAEAGSRSSIVASLQPSGTKAIPGAVVKDDPDAMFTTDTRFIIRVEGYGDNSAGFRLPPSENIRRITQQDRDRLLGERGRSSLQPQPLTDQPRGHLNERRRNA